ncbi:hypothetical protein LINPERPRIM_LOCUS31709 [Linum perenne]
MVAQDDSELTFLEESLKSVVDGVLKIPDAVLQKGADRLRGAMVGQFVSDGSSIEVVRSTTNWLWGYVGPVIVSLISVGFYLFEFASEEL